MLEQEFFGIQLIDVEYFVELVVRMLFNVTVAFIITRFIYYPKSRNNDYLFTYIMFNLLIFFICIILRNVKLQLGFALGLFAIFSILRYRTRQIPIREMTYLFTIIVVAAINGLANKKVSYAELVFTNIAIIAAVAILDSKWILKRELRKRIRYENINLIHPDKHDELLEDLKARTGINIHRFTVDRINFMRDTARISVYYYDDPKKNDDNKLGRGPKADAES